jgi:hypothetical protein
MADVGMTDFTSSDLSGADFRGANLKGANFGGAILDGANLRGADLNGADLRASKLVRADLSRADLRLADLGEADLRGADLRRADLSGASLRNVGLMSATLHGADLRGADLTGANLRGANLTDLRLEGAILTDASVGGTVFADLDLRQAKGLESLQHASPSTVGVDTLSRSRGLIPENFLRGCGFTPGEILAAAHYDATLTPSATKALHKRTLEARLQAPPPRRRILISHSGADAPFVEELRRLLLARGIFAWVAVHEAKAAVRERQSKLAIQHDLALLLVLSQNSVHSDWVQHELRLARKQEKALGDNVLCPVSLDDSWQAAPFQARITEKIAEQSVFSFSSWEDQASMETQLAKLLDAISL